MVGEKTFPKEGPTKKQALKLLQVAEDEIQFQNEKLGKKEIRNKKIQPVLEEMNHIISILRELILIQGEIPGRQVERLLMRINSMDKTDENVIVSIRHFVLAFIDISYGYAIPGHLNVLVRRRVLLMWFDNKNNHMLGNINGVRLYKTTAYTKRLVKNNPAAKFRTRKISGQILSMFLLSTANPTHFTYVDQMLQAIIQNGGATSGTPHPTAIRTFLKICDAIGQGETCDREYQHNLIEDQDTEVEEGEEEIERYLKVTASVPMVDLTKVKQEKESEKEESKKEELVDIDDLMQTDSEEEIEKEKQKREKVKEMEKEKEKEKEREKIKEMEREKEKEQEKEKEKEREKIKEMEKEKEKEKEKKEKEREKIKEMEKEREKEKEKEKEKEEDEEAEEDENDSEEEREEDQKKKRKKKQKKEKEKKRKTKKKQEKTGNEKQEQAKEDEVKSKNASSISSKYNENATDSDSESYNPKYPGYNSNIAKEESDRESSPKRNWKWEEKPKKTDTSRIKEKDKKKKKKRSRIEESSESEISHSNSLSDESESKMTKKPKEKKKKIIKEIEDSEVEEKRGSTKNDERNKIDQPKVFNPQNGRIQRGWTNGPRGHRGRGRGFNGAPRHGGYPGQANGPYYGDPGQEFSGYGRNPDLYNMPPPNNMLHDYQHRYQQVHQLNQGGWTYPNDQSGFQPHPGQSRRSPMGQDFHQNQIYDARDVIYQRKEIEDLRKVNEALCKEIKKNENSKKDVNQPPAK